MGEGMQFSLHNQTFAEQVFQHIKRMILAEQLQPGQRIPEEKIAQSFGVSRTPIREALRKLERYGLVRIVPRSHAEVVRLDEADARQLWQVRLELEGLSVRLLSAKATAEDCRAIRGFAETCQDAADEGDIASTFDADNLFHLEIAKRSGNHYVFDVLKTLSAKIHLHRTTNCTDIDKIRGDIRVHFALVDALCAGDSEQATQLMSEHIRRSEKTVTPESS
jgi:DNA-binding GntR family transcriptional regulator